MNCPARYFISSGVIKGASKVAQVVMVIESGTFALAISAITLEAKPLGEQPIRITPAAISGGKLNKLAMAKPRVGMMRNWQQTPMMTALGVLMMPTKSSKVIVVPMPNMMTCSSGMMSLDNL